MVDGFHWTRVTAKHLRFLYEEVTTLELPQRMRELSSRIDRALETLARSTPENPPEIVPPTDEDDTKV